MIRLCIAMTGFGLACAAAGASAGEIADKPLHDVLTPAAAHAADHYSSRWCIERFLRERRTAALPSRRPVLPAAPAAIRLRFSEAAADAPAPWFAADSFVNRVIEQRAWHMATLWRDSRRALYFGINQDGYLGVSLGEAPADAP